MHARLKTRGARPAPPPADFCGGWFRRCPCNLKAGHHRGDRHRRLRQKAVPEGHHAHRRSHVKVPKRHHNKMRRHRRCGRIHASKPCPKAPRTPCPPSRFAGNTQARFAGNDRRASFHREISESDPAWFPRCHKWPRQCADAPIRTEPARPFAGTVRARRHP